MKKIKAFTMVEILIISILITVGLFAVRKAIDHAKFTNIGVMQKVIANQLAAEGVEIVYQTRNTNFLQYYYNINIDKDPNKLNSCRLAYNFTGCMEYVQEATCSTTTNRCPDASKYILQSGYYYIENNGGKNKIKNCLCTEQVNHCDNIKIDKYAICLRDGVRSPCPEGHVAGGDQSKYGKFYRMIQGLGDYDMSYNSTGGQYYESSFCAGNIEAQEYRFCSRVARDGGQGGEIEICSTMTNFAEIEGTIYDFNDEY